VSKKEKKVGGFLFYSSGKVDYFGISASEKASEFINFLL